MGQDWDILNMTIREQSNEGGTNLGEFFFFDLGGLYHSLRLCGLPKSFDTWLERGSVALQPGPFGKLSPEIIGMITEHLSELEDHRFLVHFAITCKRHLAVAKPFLLQHLRGLHCPWAFCRLICLGRDTDDRDLPKGLLTDEQRAEIATVEIPGLAGEQMSLSTIASELYTHTKWMPPPLNFEMKQHRFEQAAWEWLRKARKDAAKDAKRLLELDMLKKLYFGLSPTYPSGSVPVLYNLSKAEYVREDELTEMKTWTYPHKFGLGHALVSRICWSSSDGFSLVCEEPYSSMLVNGPWAGDKFCITTLEEMPRAGPGKTWKNVTDEVDELLVYLWEENMD